MRAIHVEAKGTDPLLEGPLQELYASVVGAIGLVRATCAVARNPETSERWSLS